MMFGPHDSDSANTPQSIEWKIKRVTNDELRQLYIDQTVPQAHYLGCTVPDPDLRFDVDTGHWSIGLIDWDEFWDTVKGNGRLNRERITHKVKAWDDGAWVREAATAYAHKQRTELEKTA